MKLNLLKPLVVFDLETTGLDIVKDRIFQLSYIKIYPDGKEERENIYINPNVPISNEVKELTGITEEALKNAPSFKEVAQKLNDAFQGCDFAGFNSNHFDVPMLAEEFLRAGVNFDFSLAHLIDVQTIFHKMERRNLAAAYKFYCGRAMEDDFEAHRADQDTEATYRVLLGELERYSSANQTEAERILPNDIEALAQFSKNSNKVDFAGRFIWKEVRDANNKVVTDKEGNVVMTEVFNFGKYKGFPVVDVLNREPGLYDWIMTNDFPNNTKQVLTRIRLREMNKKITKG